MSEAGATYTGSLGTSSEAGWKRTLAGQARELAQARFENRRRQQRDNLDPCMA